MIGLEPVRSPPQTKTAAWLRRKQEIDALRREPEELETRLLFMEMNCMTANHTSGFIEMNCHQVRAKADALVAKRRREAAEDENKRLKKQVQVYLKQCEAFQATLSSADFQTSALVHGAMAPSTALRVELVAGRSLRFGDSSVLDMLERRLDARAFEMSEAFNKLKLENSTDGQFETQFLNGQIGAIQLSRVELVPFEHQVRSSAMWAIVEAGKFPKGQHSRAARRSKNAFAVHSVVTLHLASGGTIDIHGHSVIKRFQAPTGSGMLVEACSEWTIRLPDKGAWTHMAQEAACFVMHKYESGGGVVPGVCATRAEIRWGPSDFVGNTDQHRKASPNILREAVIPSFRGLVDARHQFVENTLFDIIRV